VGDRERTRQIGIDTLALKTALAAGGRTVAILGQRPRSDLSAREHQARQRDRRERRRSPELSLPFGAPPIARNLIQRDRLQSGMSGACRDRADRDQGRHPAHRGALPPSSGAGSSVPSRTARTARARGFAFSWSSQPTSCTTSSGLRNAQRLTASLGDRPLAQPVRNDKIGDLPR